MAKKKESIALSILMGVLAILFTIAILVGWSVLFSDYYALYRTQHPMPSLGASYWIILAIGCLFLVLTVTVLVLFLVWNVRQALYARQQDTFIDSVTHELKSPLASLKLCLETMELRQLAPEMQAKFFGIMKKDVTRLQALVEHILEASRLELDVREFREQAVDLGAVCRATAQRIRERYNLPESAIRLDLDLQGQERVLIDLVALETVLSNLLDNAVKYSVEPIIVDLRLGRTNDGLRIEVSDRGIGLTRFQKKRVFRRFYRAHKGVRGTGLGLYVVEALVRRLGGRIHVESEGPGRGSTFRVRLPAAPVVSEGIDAASAVPTRG